MPDDEAERTGVLVIRAWIEPERRQMIARITGRLDLGRPEEVSETAAGAAAAARLAGDWLAAFERAGIDDGP